jgi:hypothetical protein
VAGSCEYGDEHTGSGAMELVKVCLRSEDAFVITCVANLMEVKVLYVQQDLRYELYIYWRFSV